jgi:hypothetical protein
LKLQQNVLARVLHRPVELAGLVGSHSATADRPEIIEQPAKVPSGERAGLLEGVQFICTFVLPAGKPAKG